MGSRQSTEIELSAAMCESIAQMSKISAMAGGIIEFKYHHHMDLEKINKDGASWDFFYCPSDQLEKDGTKIYRITSQILVKGALEMCSTAVEYTTTSTYNMLRRCCTWARDFTEM